MSLNARLAAARLRVDALEPELAAAYEKPLRLAARRVGSRFQARALTAAVEPRWTPPDPGELVDGQQVAADANGKAQPIHERALHLVGEAAVGASFDVTSPFALSLLDGVAARSREILATYGDELQATIRDAHEQGLSVADAAKLIQARAEDASRVTAQLLARTDLNSISNGGSLLAAQLVDAASRDAGEPGISTKTWLTAGDEKVRDTHAEADGQTVPLDQPFDVGGEQLMYPGDPQGSLEEIANCRCTQIYGDSLQASAIRAPMVALSSRGTMAESLEVTAPPLVLRDFHLTAAAGEPTRWQATLLVEDEPTEDGRMIQAGATTWERLSAPPFSLPLSFLDQSQHGDEGSAPIVGRIDQIWRAGNLIQGSGVFNDVADAFAAECVQKIRDRMVSGISVDPVGGECEIVVTQREPDGYAEEQQDREEMQGIVDEPIVEVYDDDLEYLMVYTELVVGGATVCPQQAVAQARIQIVADAAPDLAPFASEFASSFCEIPTERTGSELSREDVLAFTQRSLEALAASAATTPAVVDLAPLEKKVAAIPARLDRRASAVEVALTAAVTALVADAEKRLAAAVKAAQQTLGDRIAEIETAQTANLTAAAASTEANERVFALLEDVASIAARTLQVAERKPRELRFERDDKGRLVGTREA